MTCIEEFEPQPEQWPAMCYADEVSLTGIACESGKIGRAGGMQDYREADAWCDPTRQLRQLTGIRKGLHAAIRLHRKETKGTSRWVRKAFVP